MNFTNKPALILIDIQYAFDELAHWGSNRNNPEAEENAGKLLRFWRERQLPIFHVKHNSSDPASPLAAGKPGNVIKEMVQPLESEPLICKNVNSAFIGTNLKDRLDEAGISHVVIAGLITEHCVSTTTRMAGNYGYKTYLVEDACASFDKKGMDGQIFPAQLIHDTAVATLNEEFASIWKTEQVISTLGAEAHAHTEV